MTSPLRFGVQGTIFTWINPFISVSCVHVLSVVKNIDVMPLKSMALTSASCTHILNQWHRCHAFEKHGVDVSPACDNMQFYLNQSFHSVVNVYSLVIQIQLYVNQSLHSVVNVYSLVIQIHFVSQLVITLRGYSVFTCDTHTVLSQSAITLRGYSVFYCDTHTVLCQSVITLRGYSVFHCYTHTVLSQSVITLRSHSVFLCDTHTVLSQSVITLRG